MVCPTVIKRPVPLILLVGVLLGVGFLVWNATGRKSVSMGWIERHGLIGAGWEFIELRKPWDGVVRVAVPVQGTLGTFGCCDTGRWCIVVGRRVHAPNGQDVLVSCAIKTVSVGHRPGTVRCDGIAATLVSNRLVALIIGCTALLVAVSLLRFLSVLCYGLAGAIVGFHTAVICSGLWMFPLSDDVLVGVSLLLYGAAIVHGIVCRGVLSLVSRLILAVFLWFMLPPLCGPFCIPPLICQWVAGLLGFIFPPAGIALFSAAVLAGGLGASGPAAFLILIASFLVSSAMWQLSHRRCTTRMIRTAAPILFRAPVPVT